MAYAPERMTDPAPGGRNLRVVILGWHGAKERQLRPLARAYGTLGRARGLDVEARTVLTPTFRTMARPDGWPRFGEELAASLAEAQRAESRQLVLHAFSNAGFWTMRALLDAAPPELRRAHVVTVLDSAPGFPRRVPFWFTAYYAALAMTPGVLEALGRPPRHLHPIVSPPLAAFLGAWHFVAPRQVRFMESALDAVAAAHVGKPLLAIYSDADRLVRPRHVEAFLDDAERAGVRVRRLHLAGTTHVRHFLDERTRYLDAIDRALAAT